MELTKNSLKKMVKQVLKEEMMPIFPKAPDSESKEEALENLEEDEDIIRFHENESKEGEEEGEGISVIEQVVQEEIAKYIKKKT